MRRALREDYRVLNTVLQASGGAAPSAAPQSLHLACLQQLPASDDGMRQVCALAPPRSPHFSDFIPVLMLLQGRHRPAAPQKTRKCTSSGGSPNGKRFRAVRIRLPPHPTLRPVLPHQTYSNGRYSGRLPRLERPTRGSTEAHGGQTVQLHCNPFRRTPALLPWVAPLCARPLSRFSGVVRLSPGRPAHPSASPGPSPSPRCGRCSS